MNKILHPAPAALTALPPDSIPDMVPILPQLLVFDLLSSILSSYSPKDSSVLPSPSPANPPLV